MSEDLFARRTFLQLAAGAALGAAAGASVGGARAARAQAPAPGGPNEPNEPAQTDPGAVRLGVASYSLRKFPLAKAIEMTKACGVRYINLKSFHAPYEATPEQLAAVRREVEAAGLTIVGGGTITFDKDTDESVGRYFEYAKNAGMPVVVSTCAPAVLPRVEKYAKQFDIKVAIHNHGPEDKHYPAPSDVLKYVKNMDRRMGLCVDIGHTVRAGADVVQALADAGPRLYDIHAKDLRDLKARDSQVAVGEGAIPIPDIFRQLQRQRYAGYVNLEYEINADDPLPGMQQSFAYMRGVLAGIAPSRRRA